MAAMVTKFADWPRWLQILIVAPHGILLGITVWLWWPKSDKGWRKFGLVAAYLIAFGLVMRFVFDFK